MRKPLPFLGLLALWMALAPPLSAQRDRQKEDQTVRSVQGVVMDASGNLAVGAVVHLKNTKTLQIRSFITKEDGSYAFHGLSVDVDYELRAESQDSASDVRTLTLFDSRRKAVINLKLTNRK